MATDVLLGDNAVILQADGSFTAPGIGNTMRSVVLLTPTLHLMNPAFMPPGSDQKATDTAPTQVNRPALTHTTADQLVVNLGGAYQGGTFLAGKTRVPMPAALPTLKGSQLTPEEQATGSLDLAEEIRRLRAQVLALESVVEAIIGP